MLHGLDKARNGRPVSVCLSQVTCVCRGWPAKWAGAGMQLGLCTQKHALRGTAYLRRQMVIVMVRQKEKQMPTLRGMLQKEAEKERLEDAEPHSAT